MHFWFCARYSSNRERNLFASVSSRTRVGKQYPASAYRDCCDGVSLAPFLRGEDPAGWREEAHWEYDFRDATDDEVERRFGLTLHQCGLNVIRGERYKYVHFAGLPPLFFDLQEDPGEMRNLADDPAQLPRVLEYAQKLISWRMAHDEQTLTHLALTEDGVVSRPSPRW